MSKKILIVDDSRVMRLNVIRSLRQAGFTSDPVEAADLSEAIEQLAVGDVALIISDFNVVGGGGIDLIKQVRSTPAYRSLPALLLARGLGEAEIASALAAGFQGCLKDLTDTEECRNTVSQFIA